MKDTGIRIPEILIPDERVRLEKWSVIACDQHTTNEGYWSGVERFVGGNPSTLHIMLPEIYLNSETKQERIDYTKETMRHYLEDSILKLLPAGFILVERHVSTGIRRGLMVSIDLEQYDYDPTAKAPIRATEETLVERIPPRIEIRRGADIEMPHILLLMDDVDDSVIGPIWQRRSKFPKLYDFDLMENGGRLAGYFIDDAESTEHVLESLSALPEHDGMRFCVGDGNHSLATAKAVWEEAKRLMTEEEMEASPLRYAMVELINIHDPALEIRPIHRVLFNVNPSQCIQYIVDRLNSNGMDARLVFSRRKLAGPSPEQSDGTKTILFTSRDSAGRIEINQPDGPLATGLLQPVLEQFVQENPSSSIEYIHGAGEMEAIATEYNNAGFYMPALDKSEIFDLVARCGVLPKKTFSLGNANEKRYYMECRLITPAATVEEPEELEEFEDTVDMPDVPEDSAE